MKLSLFIELIRFCENYHEFLEETKMFFRKLEENPKNGDKENLYEFFEEHREFEKKFKEYSEERKKAS